MWPVEEKNRGSENVSVSLGQKVAPDRIGLVSGKQGRVKAVVMLGQLIENKPLPQWLASTQLSMLGDGLRNNIHNPGIVPSLLYSRLLLFYGGGV